MHSNPSTFYGQATALHQQGRLAEADPARMLRGSDWPHVLFDGPMPNDGDLLALLADWAPDEKLRHQIWAENPARLYGFAD